MGTFFGERSWTLGPGIRVLVVDDSLVVRKLVTEALSTDPRIEVVGTAANGRIALAKIEDLNPDIVTLDIEMPEMDGLTALRALRVDHPRLPVIMFSTLTNPGAAAALEALAAGATDYVTKPASVGSLGESMRSVREQLVPRIHALAGRRATPPPPHPRDTPPAPSSLSTLSAMPSLSSLSMQPAQPRPTAPPPPRAHTGTPGAAHAPTRVPQVLAIGCSTGGPAALTSLLRDLPGALPIPVVVVQHMPPIFTTHFAERLDRLCALHVVEASDGAALSAGTVYIAPGDHHLEVVRDRNHPAIRVQQEPKVCFVRPSVDVLFASVARTFGGASLALVLTGMGHDGRDGSRAIRDSGGCVYVQDEPSSVVWGMPGAVAEAGLAHRVLPLTDLATAVLGALAPPAGTTGAAPLRAAGPL